MSAGVAGGLRYPPEAQGGACSSTVEPAAHNGLVAGSNPAGPTTAKEKGAAAWPRRPFLVRRRSEADGDARPIGAIAEIAARDRGVGREIDAHPRAGEPEPAAHLSPVAIRIGEEEADCAAAEAGRREARGERQPAGR